MGVSSLRSRGMERVTPVPRADGEILRASTAEALQDLMSTAAALTSGVCWDGGGTEE